MPFDPKLMQTFVVLSDVLSFRGCAGRLGVAQPWVSERLRRLEEQLGMRLIERTSRRVELTREGAAFLPYAQQILASVEAAEQAAADIRRAGTDALSLGTLDHYSSSPERRLLIQRFLQSDPHIRLNVYGGSAAATLAERLASDDVDVVFASIHLTEARPELEYQPICTRVGMLVIPNEHPLARLDDVPLEQLSGCKVVTSPGRSNQSGLQKTLAPLAGAGAIFVPAPESDRSTIGHFAQVHGLISLSWELLPAARYVGAKTTRVPIVGHPLRSTTAIWRRRGSSRAPVQRFWHSGRVLGRILHAGPDDPDFDALAEGMRPLVSEEA